MRVARLLVAVCVVSFGCSDSSGPSARSLHLLQIVSGNMQHATVGTALASPIVFEAVDAHGGALTGLKVTFAPLGASGTAETDSATTNAQGRASTTWTLGAKADTQRLSAKIVDAGVTLTDTVTAVATAGSPALLMMSAGNNQSANPGSAVTDSLAVTVADQYSNPLPGDTVTWSVTSGAGSISPAKSVTNAVGVAKARWTLGPAAGLNLVTAGASGLTPAVFAAAGGPNANVHVQLLQKSESFGALGDSATLHATVTDQNGFTIPNAVVIWTSASPGQVAVTSTGSLAAQVKSKANGAVNVYAFYNGAYDTARVTVQQVPSRIVMPDTFPNVVVGQTLALGAQVVDSNGVVVSNAPVHWSVANAAVASVNASGVATGVAVGATAITATNPSISGFPSSVRLGVIRESPSSVQFTQLVNGLDHACALSATGEAWCWGADNAATTGGVGCTPQSRNPPVWGGFCPGPVPVAGGFTFTILSAAPGATCGLTSGGASYCWGQPPQLPGSLGSNYGLFVLESTPTAVAGAPAFTSISVGGTLICGLTSSGAAYCWGYNLSGSLGNGGTSGSATPVAVNGGLTFTQISAGTSTVCGILGSGAAYCWGDNAYGQIGNGDQSVGNCQSPLAFPPGTGTSPCSPMPLPVAGAHAFRSIVVKDTTACGLQSSGAMYCWGLNASGQLGDGTDHAGAPAPYSDDCVSGNADCSVTPVQVIGGFSFATTGRGPCALDASGAAYCWGPNQNGQVGNGQSGFQSADTPTAVVGGLRFTSVAWGTAACGIATTGKIYCWGAGNQLGTAATGFNNSLTPVAVQHP